jgi:hypothetical protein
LLEHVAADGGAAGDADSDSDLELTEAEAAELEKLMAAGADGGANDWE